MTTVRDLFGRVADPAQPLLTWYDDATGERTELSAATLGNWLAKTANMLVDGLGLDEGSTALVALPPHWQTAAVLLGCAAAGVEVTDDPGADAGFATLARLTEIDRCDERFAVSLHPFALPIRDLPGGVGDWATEVRQHGDFFGAYRPMKLETGGPALTPGDRVLIDTDRHPDAATWLWGPLAAGASIVAVANVNQSTMAARAAAERVTINWAA